MFSHSLYMYFYTFSVCMYVCLFGRFVGGKIFKVNKAMFYGWFISLTFLFKGKNGKLRQQAFIHINTLYILYV